MKEAREGTSTKDNKMTEAADSMRLYPDGQVVVRSTNGVLHVVWHRGVIIVQTTLAGGKGTMSTPLTVTETELMQIAQKEGCEAQVQRVLTERKRADIDLAGRLHVGHTQMYVGSMVIVRQHGVFVLQWHMTGDYKSADTLTDPIVVSEADLFELARREGVENILKMTLEAADQSIVAASKGPSSSSRGGH